MRIERRDFLGLIQPHGQPRGNPANCEGVHAEAVVGTKVRSPAMQNYSRSSRLSNPRIKLAFHAHSTGISCYQLRSNYCNFSHFICYYINSYKYIWSVRKRPI